MTFEFRGMGGCSKRNSSLGGDLLLEKNCWGVDACQVRQP